VAHGVINKTYSVTHLAVKDAARRYSPAAVIAVSRDVMSGVPAEISTSYVERQNLTVRMSCPLRTAHQRIQQDADKPCGCRVVVRQLLQHVPRARSIADNASGRAWHRGSSLVDRRLAGRDVGGRAARTNRDGARSAAAVPSNRGRQIMSGRISNCEWLDLR
jgi:hypothetical protein